MPRRSILSVAERDSLLALPATQDELIRHYTLSGVASGNGSQRTLAIQPRSTFIENGDFRAAFMKNQPFKGYDSSQTFSKLIL